MSLTTNVSPEMNKSLKSFPISDSLSTPLPDPEMNMKIFIIPAIIVVIIQLSEGVPLRLQKRAAFYIANETACVVDNTVYNSGDPIPTDDPCEACKCRPPGFACVLKECETKPGCRAVRREGHCCPEYVCGCEHNGRMYRDGDEIRDSKNPCYTCHCQGSSIACAFVDCFFRVDCAPEYVPGECCPHYNHCSTVDSDNSSTPEYAFSTEKAYSFEDTTVNPQNPETTHYSEVPEKTSTLEVKTENDKESSESVIPAILDASVLFSSNEDQFSDSNIDTTKKDITTESILKPGANDDVSLEAESSEYSSSESQTESVTDLLKTVFEIVNDEEKHKEPISSSESSPVELSVDQSTSATPNANAELFPTVIPTTKDEVKTDHTADLTTISNAPEILDKDDDLDAKANELVKKFRSLENITSEDETQSTTTEGKEDTHSDKSKDPEVNDNVEITKLSEHSETSVVTEKATTPSVISVSSEENFKKDTESNDHASTEPTVKPEKLYYNSETKEISISVETVTPAVHVKEPTNSDKDVEETTTPASKDAEQLLFKALNDVGELGGKQETTKKSEETVTNQETVKASDPSTIKVADEVPTSPSSVSSETDKTVEKAELYGAEDDKSVSITEAHKVTEVEKGTTVTVPEVSSEKVEEPIKE
ncbi:uncharacterized protein TNCT_12461 [Trichonephila clavata]|uniref:VWFC domain-containing protein n=1 Tax=Trichonephila clavata TaxID=2740835 RepID=A0A8X6IBN5_TRICU|nr:uncharacterized protein TNCT_12461 [Trichonephila clavata]